MSVALARAPGARLRDGRVRVHRQPRQRRRRARRRGRAAVVRLHPGRPRGGEDPRDRRLRDQRRRRSWQLRRRQPALYRALGRARRGRSSTSTCGPYYAEGSKTLAFETAEQLGWELPDRVVAPIASGSLFTKVARGFQEFIEAGLLDGDAAGDVRRPGRGLLAGRARRSPPAPTSAARSSPTRSPSRWRSATRPTARTRSSSRARRAARSRASPTTRSAPASACSPRRPGIFTETAGGVTTAVLAKLAAARRRSTPTSASWPTSPATA